MLCPKIRELIKLFVQQREQKVTMLRTVISQPMKSLTIQRQTSHIRHHDERANKITFVSSLGGFHGFCSQYHFHTETRHTIPSTSHAKSMAQTTDDNIHFTLKQWNIIFLFFCRSLCRVDSLHSATFHKHSRAFLPNSKICLFNSDIM